MSAERIDVLAVMDAEISRSSRLPTAADPYVIERHHAMVDARAAVAELIEAASEVDRLSRELSAWDDPQSVERAVLRMRAALARVGGAV